MCIGLARFRRRDIRPPQRPGLQVVPRIPCHVQKSIIGFGNGALQVPEKHPDDVGIDQALDAGMVFPHVGIESRIFQRDGSLGGQQFQHLDPVRGKGMGGQIVFQVEQADQGGLAKNGQAQHGLGVLSRKVRVGRKRVRLGGIHEQHMLTAAPDILENGLGERRGAGMPPDVHGLLLDTGIRRGDKIVIMGQQQPAALRAGVFEHEAHERVDQFVEHDAAGDGLRGFGHRQHVQPGLAVG